MGLKNLFRENLIPLAVIAPLLVVPTLEHVFNRRAAAAATTADTIPLHTRVLPSWAGRSLTAGEMVLARRFFDPDFKLDGAMIYNGGAQPEGFWAAAQAFNSREMSFYGPQNYSEDYSKETNAWKFGLFFHELAHLDHYQKEAFTHDKTYGECRQRYEYTLTPGKAYDEYCTEQQATLVEDYARRFLMNAPAAYRHGLPELEHDALLAAVIEARFPGATVLRAEMNDTRRRLMDSVLKALTPQIPLSIPGSGPAP